MWTAQSMPIRIAVFVFVLGAACAGISRAQSSGSVRVTAEADPTDVRVGETVQLTVRVDGVPATVVRTPDPPATTNLAPRQRTPRTKQIRASRGGRLRQGVVFSWRLRPRQQGAALIQPLTVVVQGKEYTTAPIRVRVSPRTGEPDAPTLTRPDGTSRNESLNARDLFIRAWATNDSAYQNEQVVVEYSLFYRPGIRLRHSRLAGSWDAPGFWREELNVAARPTPQRRRAHGQAYETVVLKRVALFPTRPGTLQVDPLRIETEAQGTMRMREGGPSLRGRFEPVQLASEGLSLDVRSLPSGAPPAFDGAVGQFSMTARTDADSTSVGEPVTLMVEVEGAGNLATLSPPSVEPPPDMEVYDPSVETDIERNESRIRGTKTFAYTLVPQSAGRYDLPAVTLSYFDPDAGQYETRQATPSALQVSGEAAPRAVGRTGDGLPVGDVAEPMAASEAQWARTDRRPLYRSPWAYLALLVPALVVGAGVAYRRWRSEAAPSSDETAALDEETNRLQVARRRLQAGPDAAFYDAVTRALRAFLAERLGRDGPNDVTRTILDRHLPRHDVPPDLQDALYDVLDRCDEAQYAPRAGSAAPEDVLANAHAVLRRLDTTLPRSESTASRS
ncbi:BatD family protein [Salinibacter grassmerensis]|uniref:BatD family protein n=1 Tax=Salinibacter grassmerensis TaxID=3040353 RepID=UPI0021E7DF4A|nr:BatD family protein [Salinibacter grassmerensis]